MVTVINLRVDGDAAEVISYPEPIVTLEMLRRGIFDGGREDLVERVNGGRINLWVDESGKVRGPWTPNPMAQFILESFAGQPFPDDYLAGHVVITGGITPEGDTLGLTDDQVARILHLTQVD